MSAFPGARKAFVRFSSARGLARSPHPAKNRKHFQTGVCTTLWVPSTGLSKTHRAGTHALASGIYIHSNRGRSSDSDATL